MSGILDLDILLKDMKPILEEDRYIFCSVNKKLDKDVVDLTPLCTFQEEEGLTLVITKEKADVAGISYEGVYRKITLLVHSSLEAVGLTAAFSKALTDVNISANVIAGYYHDHIFVPEEKSAAALEALSALTHKSKKL